jgi:hypothetical protein
MLGTNTNLPLPVRLLFAALLMALLISTGYAGPPL